MTWYIPPVSTERAISVANAGVVLAAPRLRPSGRIAQQSHRPTPSDVRPKAPRPIWRDTFKYLTNLLRGQLPGATFVPDAGRGTYQVITADQGTLRSSWHYNAGGGYGYCDYNIAMTPADTKIVEAAIQQAISYAQNYGNPKPQKGP